MTPKVSVIVPVYNVEQYLERCIESIRRQTLKEVELILVDDGSKDKSGLICEQAATKDSRIKVIHQQNTGQGIARNKALEIAKGEYIAFLDSDDYVEQETYEKIIEQMELNHSQLGCFGYSQDNDKGEIVYKAKIIEKVYTGEEIKEKFILHFFGDDPNEDNLRGVSACMSVYKRDIIEKNKIAFQSERKIFSEDTLFNLEYCKHIDSAVTIAKSYYHYCLKSDSFTKGYQKDRFELTVYFTEILEKYAEYYDVTDKVSNRIRMILWVSLIDSIKQEVRLKGQLSTTEIKNNVSYICNKNKVIELIKTLQIDGLNKKQKLFYYCIKYKMYWFLILLSALRNRRGL